MANAYMKNAPANAAINAGSDKIALATAIPILWLLFNIGLSLSLEENLFIDWVQAAVDRETW
jgi:hypothetical protein